MKYIIIRHRMRPTMKLDAEALERLFNGSGEDDVPTERRPDLAGKWASRMNEVPEIAQGYTFIKSD